MKALIAAKDEFKLKTRQSLSDDKKWYVLEVENEDELLYGLSSESPELVVLDTESINVKDILDKVNLLHGGTKVLFLLESDKLDASEIIRNYLRPGLSDYISKPFDLEFLRHRIISLISTNYSRSDFHLEKINLPNLHDSATGRLDAKKIKDELGISLKSLSKILGKNYRALHKTPHSENIQKQLAVYKRIIEILYDLFEKPEDINIWLNSPNVDFGDRSPISIIKEGHADAVLDLLKNIQEGTAT
ncbi:MAG: DUF2384 domain-containing protein [Balneolaceae bacterium]|jgi:DNA-binding response OmpR family regulator|nr:MAG: DUF2384 domain-containing protein [Balneolaceae bacterium]